MNTPQENFGMRRTALALAVLATFGSVQAQESVAELTTPNTSTVRVGGAWVSGDSKDRAIFGQYNGLRDESWYGLIDIDYLTRDDPLDIWTAMRGTDLGLSTRELSVMRQKQGDWKVVLGYSELERNDIRTLNTGMTGVGTTAPTILLLAAPGTGTDHDLSTTRKGGNIELEKWLSAAWQIQFNFKNEDKNGARLFGRGYDCTTDVCNGSAATQVKNAILLVPEPINSNIKQIDAKVNYHDKQLGLTMGYYGSFYSNLRGSLNPAVPNILNNGLGVPATLYPAVPGGTSLQDVLQSPLALAPDNQAHQFYLDGHYAINPKNKVTFKLAYTHARQNEAFLGMGLPGAPAGVAGLDASVDTWRAQVGVSSRPIDKLWLLANLTYENKDDKTPSQLYNTAGSPPTFWNNYHVTARKFVGKLEASYQMTPEFRGIIGADYKTVDRAVPTNQLDEDIGGLSSMRSENDETAWRVELRRNMSENVNGSLSYSSSKRGGSDWTVLGSTSSPLCNGIPNSSGVPTCYGQQFPASTIIAINPNSPFAVHMADMERNKWKLTADWAPNENLSLNVYLENGEDKNTTAFSPVAGGKGFRNTDYKLYSFDVSYVFSDKWSMTGYASYGDQTQHINHSSGYLLALKNRNDAVGLSVLGKLGSNFHVGANLSYLNDVNEYGINAATSNTGAPASAANQAQAAIGLPDVKFKTTIFNLFGTYALQKHGDLRFDLIHQRTKFVEWTWSNNGVPFAFADNSIVTMQPEQNVTLIGVSYIYRFR